MKIGVLALQGNFEMHCKILETIGIEPVEVRYPEELNNVEGLVIPGGESTTMSKIMHITDFYEPVRAFASDYPVLGTCAGLILMSDKVIDSEIHTLSLLNIEVKRNGYGRQIYSETVNVDFDINDTKYSIPASLIRAPKVTEYGESVQIIAEYDGNPVIVKDGKHFGITFHPELDDVSILHHYVFLGSGD